MFSSADERLASTGIDATELWTSADTATLRTPRSFALRLLHLLTCRPASPRTTNASVGRHVVEFRDLALPSACMSFREATSHMLQLNILRYFQMFLFTARAPGLKSRQTTFWRAVYSYRTVCKPHFILTRERCLVPMQMWLALRTFSGSRQKSTFFF